MPPGYCPQSVDTSIDADAMRFNVAAGESIR